MVQAVLRKKFVCASFRTDRSPMEGLGLPILYISSVVQVNLIQIRTHQFFTQLMRLSGNPFQPVLVMQSTEDRSANNFTIVG